MDNRPIGMFDSGVGGMTVFKEITNLLPNENITYIGDTASFPYGSKSKETIIELSKKQVENLIQKDAKLIVIACGTATSQALEEMKKMFNIPIIGIIEPTVKYIKENKYKNVGVIGTTGTIRSKGWQRAIENEIPNCNVQSKACALLASMAEEGWTNNEVAEYTVKEYMKVFKNVDKLILGCTHYPLFYDLMKKYLPKRTEIIDVGEELALYLKERISGNELQTDSKAEGGYNLCVTDLNETFADMVYL